MSNIKIIGGESFPVEMHKVRVIQSLNLPSVDERCRAIREAGNNTFLLRNRDVFLDMLTDSGVNAMSDNQLAAMLRADDSYAGSETFYRLEEALKHVFQKDYFLPAHQGRAAEHVLCKAFVKPGDVVPMNYHFTTTKAHITDRGGSVVEIPTDEAYKINSDCKFKGNLDINKLKEIFKKHEGHVPFVRMEAGTNLIGGQPFALDNLKQVYKVCHSAGVPLVLDASLLSDNLYFVKTREDKYKSASILDITREFAKNCDIIYFSARKLSSARGGGICTSVHDYYLEMRGFIPMYEGFLTYGGMSVREMEAMAVGLYETMDENAISQGPEFIAFMVEQLIARGVPVVTPAGGLGCHLNAAAFLPHIPQHQYPAGALAAAIYMISGIRGMERGTISEQRDEDGREPLADMELVRLAMPRRVFTISQIKYAVDRIAWLYQNRGLVGGLRWDEEPKLLRFFYGRLLPVGDWQQKLSDKFKADFGDSL